MNNSPQIKAGILQDRFGFKAASYLAAGTAELPHDIVERLRAARFQAISKRKIAKSSATERVVASMGNVALSGGPDEGLGWWGRIGSVVPLVALVVGLLAINSLQSDNRALELAEVDSALLTDELPPAAFADPGFVQFLKASRQTTIVQ